MKKRGDGEDKVWAWRQRNTVDTIVKINQSFCVNCLISLLKSNLIDREPWALGKLLELQKQLRETLIPKRRKRKR